MMNSRLSSFFFRRYLAYLYRSNLNYFFPMFSKAPDYLNFAYPDFSVQYFILSLGKHEEITLQGQIPTEKIHYFSMTLYDVNGNAFYSKNDSQIEKEYSISFQPKKLSCLIIRFYKKKEYINDNFINHLPTIIPSREKLKQSDILEKNIYISNLLKKIISNKNKSIKQETLAMHDFFLPSEEKLGSLFANWDAKYLVAFAKTNIAKISFQIPKKMKNIRFIGFMASNYRTTETDDSISFSEEEPFSTIHLWVCYKKDKEQLEKLGKTKKDAIIFWKRTNKFPILIFRMVNTEKTFLNKIQNKKRNMTKEFLKQNLKKLYPTIEYF